MASLEMFMVTNNLDHGSSNKPGREKQYETIRKYFEGISSKLPAVIGFCKEAGLAN